MKWAHRITVTVFCRPEDDRAKLIDGLKALVPFDITKEKVELHTDSTPMEGVPAKPVDICTISLRKESHTNDFVKFIRNVLTPDEKIMLQRQQDRLHVDEGDYNYYLRIDKPSWIHHRKFVLTDSGDCFHIKLTLAVFPKKPELARELVNKLFTP